MPTYEYECKKCGERFDAVQSFTDEPLKRHKGGCGGSVKRVFGSVGISFKGSGFYKTDNRSSSNGGKSASSERSEKSDTKSESKSETKSESKSDSKPDTKTSSSSAS
jgi:putative FmdB family regulatory protein